jgi:hypothetical protein
MLPDHTLHQILVNTRHDRAQVRHRVVAIVILLLTSLSHRLESFHLRQPFHTSALTGRAWVRELLHGHPGRIRISLGVSKDVFRKLILTVRQMGMSDSRHVTLEEQLAIFMHGCVTGLTIRHLAERFQRSNDTISV